MTYDEMMTAYHNRRKVDHWRRLRGYECAMNDQNEILYVLNENHECRYLWKPANGGLDAIPYCKIGRFYAGLKSGAVVVR